MPANVAASAIAPRASTSSPSATAVRNDVASRRTASRDHMSLIGLAPQYGTRSSARLAANSVYGLAV